jgi:signal transduction histidine kinase
VDGTRRPYGGGVADRSGTQAFEVPLWRALAVFRVASLGWATVRVALNFRQFDHPAAAWGIIAVMAAWTVATIYGYGLPGRRGWPLLVADLSITVVCLVVSPAVLGGASARLGLANIPVAWSASPVIAWAISGGRRRGAVAGCVVGAASLATLTSLSQGSVDSPILLVLAGIAVGHVARLNVETRARLERAVELEAATRERERLARGIHDSVLQVLTLVQRRGAELGGEAAELGRLAGEQEAELRALVGGPRRTGPAAGTDGEVDLRAVLGRQAGAAVTLTAPAGPVPLPAPVADGMGLAVAAALANVRQHCGPQARAWILVEAEDGTVTVTVRDDGPGIPSGRLAEAAAAGRLGVAQSIEGRVRELGGTTTIVSVPGQGTEIELRVPAADARPRLS